LEDFVFSSANLTNFVNFLGKFSNCLAITKFKKNP
jgi:hypothetical protein